MLFFLYLFAILGIMASGYGLVSAACALFRHNDNIDRLWKQAKHTDDRIIDVDDHYRQRLRDLTDRVELLEEVIKDSVIEFLTDSMAPPKKKK